MKREAQTFFQNLFSRNEIVDLSFCRDIDMSVLREDARTMLTKPMSNEEVKLAVFSMNSFKALRLHGFQHIFFKNF